MDYTKIAVVLMSVLGIVVCLEHEHHNNSMMEDYLTEVSIANPSLTRLYSIGQSIRGHELWVLEIAGNKVAANDGLRPHVKYIGNMHGNEVISRELLLHLIEYFLTSYSTNSTIKTFLDTTTVHIMPSMNPDGYEDSEEGDCDGVQGRYNAQNVDLNRNFPDLINDDHQKPVQKETQHVMDWLDDYPFILSANLHGGALVANFPYDRYLNITHPPSQGPELTPDDDTFRFLSLTYARSHHSMAATNGQECPGANFQDGITNGADWYPVAGGMQDYNYIGHGIFEITLEVSCCKFPNGSDLMDYWILNKDALINYLLEVQQIGVKGYIIDENNNPIPQASLVIQDRESRKFKSFSNGAYFRMLMPGTYTISAEYDGIVNRETFTIQRGQISTVNIVLDIPPSSAHLLHSSATVILLAAIISHILFK